MCRKCFLMHITYYLVCTIHYLVHIKIKISHAQEIIHVSCGSEPIALYLCITVPYLSLLWHSPQSPWQHSYKSWCFSWFQVWCFPQLFLLHFSRMVRMNTESHLAALWNQLSKPCTVKALGFLLNCCFIMRQSHKFTLVMPKG